MRAFVAAGGLMSYGTSITDFPSRPTRSAMAWSLHCRDLAAMSPACRPSSPILPANGSKFCGRSSRVFSRLAVLANGHNPLAILNVGEVQAAAPKLDLEVKTLDVKRADDIAPAIEQLKGRTQAIYVVGDSFVFEINSN